MNRRKKFDLQELWKEYQDLTGLPEYRMHPDQRRETKRAFYGACGQILVLLRDKVGALEEKDAIAAMQDMINQVANFWNNEVNNREN